LDQIGLKTYLSRETSPVTLYITIYIKLKSHKIPGEQSANAEQQRQQREGNVLKMAITIVLGVEVIIEDLIKTFRKQRRK